MSNVNPKIFDESELVRECYLAQTRAFAPVEYRFIADFVEAQTMSSMLDVGAGEGTFVRGLAARLPRLRIQAIDADERLIAQAIASNGASNLTFGSAVFGPGFAGDPYDLVHARFAAEHMPDVAGFVLEASKRLRVGGMLLVTEYYVDDLDSESVLWREFRKRELRFYERHDSHPRLSTLLPKYFRAAGLTGVESTFQHVTPSTIDRALFYSLVGIYARLYRAVDPEVFTEDFTREMLAYCEVATLTADAEDGLLISHTTGRKP